MEPALVVDLLDEVRKVFSDVFEALPWVLFPKTRQAGQFINPNPSIRKGALQSACNSDPRLAWGVRPLMLMFAEVCGAASGSGAEGFARADARLRWGHPLTPIHTQGLRHF
jgi:hypothetical protein